MGQKVLGRPWEIQPSPPKKKIFKNTQPSENIPLQNSQAPLKSGGVHTLMTLTN